jgi:MFS family permease
MQGMSASLVIGYFVAGWLNQFYHWRVMFVMIGLPGLVLAALAWFTLTEPRRSERNAVAAPSEQVTLGEVCVTLWRNTTFRHLLYACSVIWFFSYGTTQWIPTFFIRSFGMRTGELGTWIAVIYGGTSIVGTYWGGEWASRHATGDERLQLRGMAVVCSASGLFTACVFIRFLAPNSYMAFTWLGLATLVGMMVNGPLFAVIQTLVPGRMRAMSIAIVYLFSNLIGLGFGPWAAGVLSDALVPWAGDDSLRYSMLILCPGFTWAAWHLWAASNTAAQDARTIEAGAIPHAREDDIASKAAVQASIG